MQGTRLQLLTVLKRSNGATVDELAQAVGLAPVSVRQQLLILQRDGYVASQEVRGAPGRPYFRYSVTLAGDDLFPKGYHRLLAALLDEVRALEPQALQGLEGDDKVRLLLRKAAHRQVAQRQQAPAGRSMEDRVVAVSSFLEEEGSFGEWERTEDGFRIIGYNCPYQRVAQGTTTLCSFHAHLVGEMLGATVVQEAAIAEGAGKCSFLIWPNGTS